MHQQLTPKDGSRYPPGEYNTGSAVAILEVHLIDFRFLLPRCIGLNILVNLVTVISVGNRHV